MPKPESVSVKINKSSYNMAKLAAKAKNQLLVDYISDVVFDMACIEIRIMAEKVIKEALERLKDVEEAEKEREKQRDPSYMPEYGLANLLISMVDQATNDRIMERPKSKKD